MKFLKNLVELDGGGVAIAITKAMSTRADDLVVTPASLKMSFLTGDLDVREGQQRRGVVGVCDCESSDYIKGRDGACLHTVGFFAGASA